MYAYIIIYIIVTGVQRQIDSFAASYREQQSELFTESSDELINKDLSSYHNFTVITCRLR